MCLLAAPASAAAQEEPLALSGAASWVSDYRFRGISLNDRDFALQGEVSLAYGGWHVSGWASAQRAVPGADVETDVTIGRGFSALGLSWDVGGIVYLFPGSRESVYGELYAAAQREIGPVTATGRVHYVPSQPNSGQRDNLYLAGDLSYALPAPASSPFSLSLNAHFGYEDGAFADKKWDVETGIVAGWRALQVSVSYVATVNGGPAGDDAVLLRIGAVF